MPYSHSHSKVHLKASCRILLRNREVVHKSYPKWSGVPSPSAVLDSFSLSLPSMTAWGFFCVQFLKLLIQSAEPLSLNFCYSGPTMLSVSAPMSHLYLVSTICIIGHLQLVVWHLTWAPFWIWWYFFLCIQASAQSQQQKEQLERLRKDMGSVALDTGTATGIRGSLVLGTKRGVHLFLLSGKILIFKGRKRKG